MSIAHQSILARRVVLKQALQLGAGLTAVGIVAACGGGTAAQGATSVAAPVVTVSSVPSLVALSVSAVTAASVSAAAPTAAPTVAPTSGTAAAPTPTAVTAPAVSVASGGAKTITYWGEFCGDDVKRLPALLTPFEQAHPGTKVEVIPVCESGVSELENLTALFAGGSPPDLLFWTGTIASIARTNLAADLGPLVTRDKVDLTQFNPALLDFYARWEGKLYGLPIGYGGNGLAVVYNRTLFKNASIAEPPTKWGDATWTWDSMVAIGQKLTKVTGNTFQQVGWSGLGYYMDVPQLWQTSWITTDLKTIVCDTAAMVDCYTHYGDLTTKYHVTAKPGEQTPKGGFLSGTVGMGTIGGWQFTDYAKATNLDWAFAPYPKVVASGGQTSPVLLELANGAKHQEDGWTLMQYLLQDSRQGIWQNYVPVQPDVRTKWGAQLFAGRDVRVQVLMGAIEAALPDDRILLTKSWPQMSKPVGDAMTNLRAGKETAENTLRALKPQLQGILDQNG